MFSPFKQKCHILIFTNKKINKESWALPEALEGSEQLLNAYIFLCKIFLSGERKKCKESGVKERESCRKGTPIYALQLEDQPSPWTSYCPWQSIQTGPPCRIGVFIHDVQRLLVSLSPHVICVGGRSKPDVLQTCSTNALPMFLPASSLLHPGGWRQALFSYYILCSLALYQTLLTWLMLVMMRAWGLVIPQAEAKTLDSADLMAPISPWCNWKRTKMIKIQGRTGTSVPQRHMWVGAWYLTLLPSPALDLQ